MNILSKLFGSDDPHPTSYVQVPVSVISERIIPLISDFEKRTSGLRSKISSNTRKELKKRDFSITAECGCGRPNCSENDKSNSEKIKEIKNKFEEFNKFMTEHTLDANLHEHPVFLIAVESYLPQYSSLKILAQTIQFCPSPEILESSQPQTAGGSEPLVTLSSGDCALILAAEDHVEMVKESGAYEYLPTLLNLVDAPKHGKRK